MDRKSFFTLACLTFFLIGLWAGNASSLPGEDAFDTANGEFKDLLTDKAKAGRRDSWENLGAKFLKIQKNNSKAEIAPKAIFMYARCMEELGLRSRSKADFRAACQSFADTATKYPKHSWADDALLRKAAIERDYLKDPAAAQKTLKGLLAKFKNGDMRGKAQAMLNELKSGNDPPQAAEGDAGAGKNASNAPGASQRGSPAGDDANGVRTLRSITVRASASKAQVEIELSRSGRYLCGYSRGKAGGGQMPYLVLEFEDSHKADDVRTVVSVPKGPIKEVRTTEMPGGGKQCLHSR